MYAIVYHEIYRKQLLVCCRRLIVSSTGSKSGLFMFSSFFNYKAAVTVLHHRQSVEPTMIFFSKISISQSWKITSGGHMKINFLARNLADNTHYVKADNFRSKTLNFVQQIYCVETLIMLWFNEECEQYNRNRNHNLARAIFKRKTLEKKQ